MLLPNENLNDIWHMRDYSEMPAIYFILFLLSFCDDAN